jgi:hypothetical protein
MVPTQSWNRVVKKESTSERSDMSVMGSVKNKCEFTLRYLRDPHQPPLIRYEPCQPSHEGEPCVWRRINSLGAHNTVVVVDVKGQLLLLLAAGVELRHEAVVEELHHTAAQPHGERAPQLPQSVHEVRLGDGAL